MISLCEPRLNYCDLDLEDSNPFFAHDTLAYNDTGFGYKKVQRFMSPKLTLIQTFNLGCDIDLEHSNPVFSLDIDYDGMPSNLVWLQKTHWFRTNKRYSRNRDILII